MYTFNLKRIRHYSTILLPSHQLYVPPPPHTVSRLKREHTKFKELFLLFCSLSEFMINTKRSLIQPELRPSIRLWTWTQMFTFTSRWRGSQSNLVNSSSLFARVSASRIMRALRFCRRKTLCKFPVELELMLSNIK